MIENRDSSLQKSLQKKLNITWTKIKREKKEANAVPIS